MARLGRNSYKITTWKTFVDHTISSADQELCFLFLTNIIIISSRVFIAISLLTKARLKIFQHRSIHKMTRKYWSVGEITEPKRMAWTIVQKKKKRKNPPKKNQKNQNQAGRHCGFRAGLVGDGADGLCFVSLWVFVLCVCPRLYLCICGIQAFSRPGLCWLVFAGKYVQTWAI